MAFREPLGKWPPDALFPDRTLADGSRTGTSVESEVRIPPELGT